MRPVNLLPPKHRPHQPSGGKSGSSYVVLGALGLALLALVAYVSESNKITTAKSDIAVAQQKTADARARSQQLGPFANFAQIKEQRVASVKSLAEGRFDWERSVRELAHVLPDGVWLEDFDAAVSGAESGSSTTGGDTAWTGPSIKLHGCAQKQPQVAVMMVRLREMQGVHDVTLTDSTRGEDPEKTAGAATTDSAGTTDGCGAHNDRANYEFNAVVEFEQQQPAPAKGAGETPVRLGGGQ
jgi:Tfp pilus assembly protein PilN